MTPGARLAAAIEVLDAMASGASAEGALTKWGRSHRFAGSGDRAAIGDHVYDVLRRRRSCAALGGASTGRGLILGLLRGRGLDPAEAFTGVGHAPPPPAPDEDGASPDSLRPAMACDVPDWLFDRFMEDLGARAIPMMQVLRHRAPVFLRTDLRHGDRAAAIASLAADGILAIPHPDVETALEVTGNERKIRTSSGYLSGAVDLQDASSQAAVLALPLCPGQRVLDYCAGGGGKALAIAAAADVQVIAHDAHPARMTDLPFRAARAGLDIALTATDQLRPATFDLVVVDAPCSGSGTWRRDAAGKWRLTPALLAETLALQARILDAARAFVRPGGTLAYMTCSILSAENQDQAAAFCARHSGWRLTGRMQRWPDAGGDGFHLSLLAAT